LAARRLSAALRVFLAAVCGDVLQCARGRAGAPWPAGAGPALSLQDGPGAPPPVGAAAGARPGADGREAAGPAGQGAWSGPGAGAPAAGAADVIDLALLDDMVRPVDEALCWPSMLCRARSLTVFIRRLCKNKRQMWLLHRIRSIALPRAHTTRLSTATASSAC
jgi:hypothetical protein